MLYGEYYTLQKTDRILLYGAATTGAILYKNLTRRGFCVTAFIDQRADEIDCYYDLPVWDAATAGRYADEMDAVVILAIKNVFEHERVADVLWRAGARKIIFRPYKFVNGEGSEPERLLNAAYDQVSRKDGILEMALCPEIAGPEKCVLKDHAVIAEQNGYVTANIPVPYVFTDQYEDPDNFWGDIPCLGLLPHLGLFDVFNGKWNPDYAEYMKYCRQAAEKSGGIVTSKAWEASVYQNRLDVFNHMQYSWEHDREFFVRNAVEGIYNPKGYFNIRSGKHRISYMLIKGSRYIPLRIKKADYEIWRRKDQAFHIAEYLWDNHIETLPIVLTNPYFYQFASTSSVFYEKVLFNLIDRIYRGRSWMESRPCFQGKRLLFVNTPMALYAEIFHMIGFEVYIRESSPARMELNKTVLSTAVFKTLETLNGGPEEYDAAVWEETVPTEMARIAITICGKMGNNRKPAVCGIAEGRPKYAFFSTDL